MDRFALYDPAAEAFLSDHGDRTNRLHFIRIFGSVGDAEAVRRLDERLQLVACKGDWCAQYKVRTKCDE